MERRFWVPVIGFFVAFLCVCQWPDRLWDAMSASNFVLLATFVAAWWRPREDRPRFVERMHQEALAKQAARRAAREGSQSGK